MFSKRIPPHSIPNALSQRVADMREAGISFADLTESNPTRAGFTYPEDLLRSLSRHEALTYDPRPFGLLSAREAVAADYARRGATVDPGRVVLTASTSEAYSWLFKLLCNPGECVLVPRPSYPLFDHLTQLDGIHSEAYDLHYGLRWDIDLAGLEHAITGDTRAVLVVSPNNPTGSYISGKERAGLTDICAKHNLALIADEVFVDYSLEGAEDRATDVSVQTDAIAFSLGGLSKTVGLPQLKLGWIVVGGPAPRVHETLAALELVADSYLSVSTPVQVAAEDLLKRGGILRGQIHDRVRDNLRTLRREAGHHPSCEVFKVEGGWYAVVRVPAGRPEESLVLELLQREHVLVHPGYFFDFATEAYVIVSLLPPPDIFVDAVGRLLRHASL